MNYAALATALVLCLPSPLMAQGRAGKPYETYVKERLAANKREQSALEKDIKAANDRFRKNPVLDSLGRFMTSAEANVLAGAKNLLANEFSLLSRLKSMGDGKPLVGGLSSHIHEARENYQRVDSQRRFLASQQTDAQRSLAALSARSPNPSELDRAQRETAAYVRLVAAADHWKTATERYLAVLEGAQPQPAQTAAISVHDVYEKIADVPPATLYQVSPTTSVCDTGEAALVFEVDDAYRISNEQPYTQFIEREVFPALLRLCPSFDPRFERIGMMGFRLRNYVKGYRLVEPDSPNGQRLYPETGPLPRGVNGQNKVEVPLSTTQMYIDTKARRFAGVLDVKLPRSLEPPALPNSSLIEKWSIASLRSVPDQIVAAERTVADERQRVTAARLAQEAEDRQLQSVAANWSYAHGQGFEVSEWTRRQENRASAIVSRSNGATLLGSLLQTYAGQSGPPGTMSEVEALSIRVVENRRHYAESVLATLTGWTPDRLRRDFEIAGYATGTFLRDVVTGQFTSWLGQAPEGPSGLTVRARGRYLDAAYTAYHQEFEAVCAARAPGPWTEYRIQTDQVTVQGPAQIEIGRTMLNERKFIVRNVYVDAFSERMMNKRGGQGDASIAGLLTGAPPTADFRADFRRFLGISGCSSDLTRQMEVNLYLLADGFPPVQVLLTNPTVAARRAGFEPSAR